MKQDRITWAFSRLESTTSPKGGFVMARTAKDAIRLINFAHGPVTVNVYSTEHAEEWTWISTTGEFKQLSGIV